MRQVNTLPRRFIAVDPGVDKGHGVAEYWDGQLVDARLLQVNVVEKGYSQHAYVEVPEVVFRGDAAKIIRLARSAERAVAVFVLADAVTYVSPTGARAWKKGHKAEHQLHCWYALDERAKGVIERESRKTPAVIEKTLVERAKAKRVSEWQLGNVLDAVYLGQWVLGSIDVYGRKKGET